MNPAFPRIVPTTRAAVLIALAAPFALLIAALAPAAWIARAGAGAGAAAAGAGRCGLGGAAGRPARGRAGGLRSGRAVRSCRAGRSRPGTPRISHGFAGARSAPCARRALRTGAALRSGFGKLAGHGAADAESARRGPVETVWLRWTGPLGLGARLHRRSLARRCASGPTLPPCARPPCRPSCAMPRPA